MENLKQRLLTILENSEWNETDRIWLLEYLESSDTSVLQKIMQDEFKKDVETDAELTDQQVQKLLRRIHFKIKAGLGSGRLVHISLWKRVAAAAAILLVLGSASYFLFFNNEKKEIAKTNINTLQKIDIPPGGNKAVLTLGDNRIIILDSAKEGMLTQQGNTKILKLDDGQLAYNSLKDPSSSPGATEVLYNTITTPRGGQYQLTLADGSKVWLNTASSIRFPVAFVGTERKVEITGEAYFEVAPSISPNGGGKLPFKVEVNGKQEVEVLGTHFNINAYSDETTINTTLLEGSVKVTSLITNDSKLISPGQQAQVNNLGQINIDKNANTDEAVSWKNGWFNFNSAGIETIMRQIGRWYDVEVNYSGNIGHETFTAMVKRSSNISAVLKIMEEGGIKFKMDNKKIVVLQ